MIAFIRGSPNKWKQAVNKAKTTAILTELWAAECQQYRGLTYRLLVRHGAVVPPEISPQTDSTEICAVCGVVFKDLAAWSHHAFKCHGRTNPVRSLASGSQCPVCLKQFKANKGLCNHLSYSTSCRHALINSGVVCRPEPGTGSRKFDDGSARLMPATQAQGPGQCWDFSPAIEEHQQPCEEVLTALEDIFCHESVTLATREGLLRRIKAVFSSQCLQRSRLQATASQWLANLETALADDDFASVQWATWHSQIARFLIGVNFTEWLGEGCADVEQCPTTFRNAEVLLPWLEVPAGFIDVVKGVKEIGFCYVPDDCSFSRHLPSTIGRYLHGQCIRHPAVIDFAGLADGLASSQCVLVSCESLLPSFVLPSPLRTFRNIAGPLNLLRLHSDLLRGVLYLWVHRAPACIFLPAISCPAVEVIRKIAPVRKQTICGELLANFDLEEDVFCFTSLI